MMYPAYYPAWVLEEIPDTDYPDASGGRLSSPRTAYREHSYVASTGEFDQDLTDTFSSRYHSRAEARLHHQKGSR